MESSNKRIAKNTIFLYVRMLFSTCISLYTSRVILNTLGVDDFGIYNVVGGVVAMFSFLNASMSSATSRFLSFEIGREDFVRLHKVFSSAFTVHLLIALCVFVLGETIGLWFLQHKLVLPADRMFAANVIYQVTILMGMLNVIQVPSVALIMSNERMNVYAFVEILNVCLKLLVVFLLLIIPADKLIVYGLLQLLVAILVFMIYVIYSRRTWRECRFKLFWNKKFLKPIFSFSGWDLYGNFSTLVRTQGVSILLNIFFGTVLNAASGIATQVQGAVGAFAWKCIDGCSSANNKELCNFRLYTVCFLIEKTSIFTTILLLLFTIPLLVETEYVLSLWLGVVPAYTVVLCRYVLLFNLFANLSSVIVTGIHATGRIKRPSIINGTLYLLVLPFSYVAYHWGQEPQIAFAFNVIAVFCGMLFNMWTLHLYVPNFRFVAYFRGVLVKGMLIAFVTYSSSYWLILQLERGFIRLVVITLFSSFCLLLFTYFFVLSNEEKAKVKLNINI